MDVRTPAEVVQISVTIGQNKINANKSISKLTILSILAGCYIALGGILSLIVGYGFPQATQMNPALQKLLSGIMFPIGLLLVVVLGAELFTGNNALLMPGLMQKKFKTAAVIKNWTIVYIGNFIGAITFTWLMVYSAGLTAPEPWHSSIINIANTKVSLPWITIFIRGIGANWCVCLAVWLALSGHSLIEKIAGCWIPVMAFVALGFEHSIANMFFIPAGIFEGADITVTQFVINNLIPATIGNIIGGALFVGCVHAMLYLKKI